MKKKVLVLGTVCTDKATELEGTLTHWTIDMGGGINYLFQPKGLDENELPVKKLFLEEARLNVSDANFEIVDVPFEVIGSIVRSKSSGYTGMAVGFVRHINGCFHISIQPKGLSRKTKMPIQKCDFDFRDCAGDKIVELPPKELAASKASTPSPTDDHVGPDIPASLTSPTPVN